MAFRHIVCAIDFSEGARKAVDQAMALARWTGARLAVLHVVTPVTAAPGAPGFAPGNVLWPDAGALTEEIRRFADLARMPDLDVVIDVQEGRAAATIVRYAEDVGADLVVVGSHGRSGLSRLVLGSVAGDVLRTAPCPVLTVPPHVTGVAFGPDAPATAIVCAIDFSETSRRAVGLALSLAEGGDAVVTVAHVMGHDLATTPELYDTALSDRGLSDDAFRERHAAFVDARLRELVPDGDAAVEVELAEPQGRPAAEILRLAEARTANLIVLGISARGGADLLLHGSTTHDVLHRATCPVLTVAGPGRPA